MKPRIKLDTFYLYVVFASLISGFLYIGYSVYSKIKDY